MQEIGNALVVILGITMANIVWAAKKKNWEEATKRSFYQAIAIFLYLLATYLSSTLQS